MSTDGQDMFAEWLELMQPRLLRFVDFLRPDGVPDDFSRESLAGLETYLLERYPDADAVWADPDLDFVDGAVRFLGETYLQAYGGGWRYSEDPDFVFSGRFHLQLDIPESYPISPIHLIAAVAGRRTGRELVKVYDGQRLSVEERRAVDPSFVPARESVPGVFISDADDAAQRGEGRPFLEAWLPEMDASIDRWRAGLGPEVADRLDGTTASLAVVQEVLLDRLDDPDEAEAEENAEFVDGAARYIGTVFHRAAGGEWRYLPGRPDRSELTGRPFLNRRDRDGDEQVAVPHRIIRATVKVRTGGVLTQMLQNYAM